MVLLRNAIMHVQYAAALRWRRASDRMPRSSTDGTGSTMVSVMRVPVTGIAN